MIWGRGKSHVRSWVVVGGFASGLVVAAETHGWSQQENADNGPLFRDHSFEQLAQISVSSPSKKEERLSVLPAAVAVLTADEIARSSATVLPELLRGVPGVEVAQVNANVWAVSARGFNNPFANKLLVLIDGRTIYSGLNAGVFWHLHDLLFEDIDRVEVIRGPGGTVWGANAVNGVVSFVTKSARDTQGLLATGLVGTWDRAIGQLRYGGRLGDRQIFYRVDLKYREERGIIDSPDPAAKDAWRGLRAGLRVDTYPTERDHLTFDGGAGVGQAWTGVIVPDVATLTNPVTYYRENFSTGHALARWMRKLTADADLTAQAYVDHTQVELYGSRQSTQIYDGEVRGRVRIEGWNELVLGLGYRRVQDNLHDNAVVRVSPQREGLNIFNGFLVDELFFFEDALRLSLGTKLEHNDVAGWALQPSGRVAFSPDERHTLWAAVSRALRTPARIQRTGEADLRVLPPQPPNLPVPVLLRLYGNPDLDFENLIAYELGYRLQAWDALAVDVATFLNRYDDLIIGQPMGAMPSGTGFVINRTGLANAGKADVIGAELGATWQVGAPWRLRGSYTFLHEDRDPETDEGNSSKHRFSVFSQLALRANLEWLGALHYVDPLPGQDVPRYVRLDLGLRWIPFKAVELSVWGRNLVSERHAEFGNTFTGRTAEVPRNVFGQVIVRLP